MIQTSLKQNYPMKIIHRHATSLNDLVNAVDKDIHSNRHDTTENHFYDSTFFYHGLKGKEREDMLGIRKLFPCPPYKKINQTNNEFFY
jgi:hypothetical protein